MYTFPERLHAVLITLFSLLTYVTYRTLEDTSKDIHIRLLMDMPIGLLCVRGHNINRSQ